MRVFVIIIISTNKEKFMKLIDSKCGKKVWALDNQIEAINNLIECRKGGCATVNGYVPKSGYVKDQYPTVNITALTRISTTKLYERRLQALNNITFDDVKDSIPTVDKLKVLDDAKLQQLFAERKAMLTTSLTNTLTGNRTNAHHKGHDRCYASFGEGVKVHLKTETVDGIKQPILVDGYPVVNSIMISVIELNRKTIKEGEYKVVNSGAPVLMGKLIEKQLNSKSHVLKTLSLKKDNFESLHIDRRELLAEEMQSLGDIIA